MPADVQVLRKAVFDPDMAETGFDGKDTGAAAAYDIEFGLAAYVYSSLDRGWWVSVALEVGMARLNSDVVRDNAVPFGSVR